MPSNYGNGHSLYVQGECVGDSVDSVDSVDVSMSPPKKLPLLLLRAIHTCRLNMFDAIVVEVLYMSNRETRKLGPSIKHGDQFFQDFI